MRVALGGCLLALQAGLLIPLVYEVSANRSGKGISLLAEALWVSAGLGWLTYGMLSGSSVLVASGALAFAGSAVVGSLIYRSKSPRERRDAWVGAVLTAAIYAVSSRLWGLPGISAALSVDRKSVV